MAPKTFDFYTCKLNDLLEFEIPIDFIAARTAVMHGLASWFDLDFEANSSNQRIDDDEEELVRQWDYPVGSNASWLWMPGELPLNPGPTPDPPRKGVKVTLSTGPNGELSTLEVCSKADRQPFERTGNRPVYSCRSPWP